MPGAGLILALALAAASAPPNAATTTPPTNANYFLGTWRCAGVRWSFARLVPGSPWIQNVYGDPAHPAGSAVIGYVSGLHAWVYRDFHSDGSYADVTSGGPANGKWEWTGPYYPGGGGPPLYGRVTYVIVSPTRYNRVFETLKNGALVRMGGDTCTKESHE